MNEVRSPEFATPCQDQWLHVLPQEVRHRIGYYCDAATLDSLSKVSKHARQWFIGHLFSQVRFDGQPRELLAKLLAFTADKEHKGMVAARDLIQRITIVINEPAASRRHGWSSTTAPTPQDPEMYRPLVRCIVKSIEMMPKLHDLTLDLKPLPPRDQDRFIYWMEDTKPWKLTHLRVNAPGDLEKEIMEHCDGSILNALHLYRGFRSQPYIGATRFCTHLTRLRLTLGSPTSSENATSTNARVIHHIASKFPDLEWLVLYEKESISRPFPTPNIFQIVKADLREALRSFEKLERFAFTFRPADVTPIVVPFATTDDWYRAFIKDIFGGVPKIKEVCMMADYPVFFRGIRRSDNPHEVKVTKEYADEVAPNSFPLGLTGDDS